MTFKDVILEASMYDHSNEYFELCKECSEVELTEKLIEDQKFMQENASLLEGTEISPNFFTEAAEEPIITALMEKTEKKKKGILSRLSSGIKNLIKRFANFLLKISGSEKKKNLKKKAKEKIKDRAFQKGWNEEGKEFDKALKDLEEQTGLYIGLNNGKWSFKDFDKFVLDKGVEMYMKEPGRFSNAVAIKDIEAVVRGLKANPNNDDIKDLTRQFEEAISNIRKRAKVTISNDDPDLVRIQKEFNEWAQSLNAGSNNTDDNSGKDGSNSNVIADTSKDAVAGVDVKESVMFESEDISGSATSDLNRLTALLNKSIADTMKLMTAYNTLSTGVLTKICSVG